MPDLRQAACLVIRASYLSNPNLLNPSRYGMTDTATLLTADQLAARRQVPKSQIYRLAREGRIPTVEIGRYYRFKLTAVEDFEDGKR